MKRNDLQRTAPNLTCGTPASLVTGQNARLPRGLCDAAGLQGQESRS